MNAKGPCGFVLATSVIFFFRIADGGLGQSDEEKWPYLLLYPVVQKDLHLSAAQQEKAGEILSRAAKRLDQPAHLVRPVMDVMNADQRKRIHEIRYQILLSRGVLAPDLIDKLELSSDVKTQLNKILAENDRQNSILHQRLKSENLRVPGVRDKLKRKYYDPARKRLLGALTPEQRSRLNKSMGKEFPAAFDLSDAL